jgi:hypothetical protein
MSERAANLFLFVEGEVVKSLGAVAHDLEGDDDRIIAFLRSRVAVDASRAARYPLPVACIKSWLGVDAEQGLPFEMYSYLERTGKVLHLFEDALQAIKAPQRPLVCITPIVDGKPRIEVLTHVDPPTCPVTLSEECDGLMKRTDWLAAYVTPSGFDVHALLEDDFTGAIKLLYAHKHYVSAMKLIVSLIDTVAYLDLGDVTGNYLTWLSKYAVLAPVGVTPLELWEFRNAILHMTNPLSRKVLSGNASPLGFYIDSTSKAVRIDQESATKVFSFEALYDAIVEAVSIWTKSYSGDLSRQLEFIKRYDTVLSEGRVGKFRPRGRFQDVPGIPPERR